MRNMVRRPAPRPDLEQEGGFRANGARAKAALNKAILAFCWGRFLTRLEHKMPDGTILRVDPKNTSGTCAACGHCASGNRESQAVFGCKACGHAAHADTNAALNILARAIGNQAPGHGVCGRSKPSGSRWQRQPTGCVAAENPRHFSPGRVSKSPRSGHYIRGPDKREPPGTGVRWGRSLQDGVDGPQSRASAPDSIGVGERAET